MATRLEKAMFRLMRFILHMDGMCSLIVEILSSFLMILYWVNDNLVFFLKKKQLNWPPANSLLLNT
jgi:hypothetical protein